MNHMYGSYEPMNPSYHRSGIELSYYISMP